jgi:hypothetical protein
LNLRGSCTVSSLDNRISTRGTPISYENETLRWPTNLDHPAIVKRLVQVREMAQKAGQADFAARFTEVETMPRGQLGAAVIGALTFAQEKPEFSDLATQLAMVAMNLKNLR